MIFLLLSIACSAMISVAMRLGEEKAKSKFCMLATNYLACLLLSWGYMGFGAFFPQMEGSLAVLGMGTFNGFFYMLALVTMQYNISRNGIVLSSVFSKMGALLIPLFMAILLFGEAPTELQFIGFLLSVASILLLNYRKDGTGVSGRFNLTLLALLLTEGCAGIMAKVFQELGNPVLSSHFLFYTFTTAFLFCGVVILWRKERPGKAELLYGLMIGLPNFFSARFLLMSLEQLPAVVVYPSRSVGSIVLITLVGFLVFRERLRRQQWVGMVIMMAALILLNL